MVAMNKGEPMAWKWNRKHMKKIKSNNLADMIAAEEMGLTLKEYIKLHGSKSQWQERINVEQPINPHHQWGNKKQNTRKDQDR